MKRTAGFLAFVLLLAVLAGLLLLRVYRSAPDAELPDEPLSKQSAGEPEPAEENAQQEPAASPVAEPEMTAAPVPTAEPLPSPAPEPSAAPQRSPRGYTARTYQLVSDMIFVRRSDAPDGDELIRALVQELKEADPALGVTWAGIMDYWQYANREMPINAALPDDLPQDDSLCLVVLGFQLLYDGDMAPELLGRCELALRCAQQYPNAYIAVTGGGTAAGDRTVTEAGVMADWLAAQGIAPERIIREDTSLTTDQNASNTCAILMRDYPQVSQLAILSSDYHIPLGCTMFTEAALLSGYHNGEVPYTVVSNAAWPTDGSTPGFSGMKNQASYVWIMAAPSY